MINQIITWFACPSSRSSYLLMLSMKQALANMMEKGSKTRWGNLIGYILLPFTIALQDNPLDHVRKAKATIDRKKRSLESICTFLGAVLVLRTFGVKVQTYLFKPSRSDNNESKVTVGIGIYSLTTMEKLTKEYYPNSYCASNYYSWIICKNILSLKRVLNQFCYI